MDAMQWLNTNSKKRKCNGQQVHIYKGSQSQMLAKS